MPASVDPHHLLLIGPDRSRRRRGSTVRPRGLISRDQTLDQLAVEMRSGGLEIDAIRADIEDLSGYRETLERIFSAPGAPGVVKPGTNFDPDNIAELFWTAHTDPKEACETAYRFTGA